MRAPTSSAAAIIASRCSCENGVSSNAPGVLTMVVAQANSAKVSQTEVDAYVDQLAEQRVITYAKVDPNTFEFDVATITEQTAHYERGLFHQLGGIER